MCGVFEGGDYMAVRTNCDRRITVVDSFAGVEKPTKEDGDTHIVEGTFSVGSKEAFFANCDKTSTPLPDETHQVVLGRDNTDGIQYRDVALLWVDVDFYAATYAALKLFLPMVVDGGTVLVRNYGTAYTIGIAKACEQFQLTWEQAEARIRRAKARNPALTIVALDYIGLLKKKRGQTAQDVIDEAADGMAALANELNVFFLCLAQLNRECETRGDKRPDPSNLRNSGKLEQAAGHVIFVQRPGKYDAWAEYEDVFWIKEAKGRHGKIREACICFDGSTQRVYGPAVPDPVRATFGTQAEQPADGELGGDEIGANW